MTKPANKSGTRQQALLAAGLLLCFISVESGETAPGDSTELWAAPDRSLVLFQSGGEAEFRICPEVRGVNHQPFCRRFEVPVLGACGLTSDLRLVLANGEIHHVNQALIGVDGDFEPSHRPKQAMELARVWIPQELCFPGDEFINVMAVSAAGSLWHFDGQGWSRISGYRVGLLGSE